MTCFNPLQAIRIDSLENPIRVISKVQSIQLKNSSNLLQLPCGKCVGCRLQYSKSWAVRNTHESSLYEFNSFVTFTYNDHFNDSRGGSLCYVDFQLMLKRLRKALDQRFSDYAFLSDDTKKLRYFMCGEYGSKTFRPHFHALFFNLDFSDKVLHSVKNGFKLYISETLNEFWRDSFSKESFGYVVLGQLTFESCAYVSRYCVKKALQADELVFFNKNTGEFLQPEKTNMSRRPGIAKSWFDKYSSDVYPGDKVVMHKGLICKPPRYYDNLLEKLDSSVYEKIKQSRVDYASSDSCRLNSTTQRLIVREKIQLKKLELLPRIL